MLPADLAAGTPSHMGKVGEACTFFTYFDVYVICSSLAALADADPLGVNQNVTFDEVGGLDDRMFSRCILATESHCPQTSMHSRK
jgi:ATPase family AAA domain-containing protein 2